MIDEDIETYDVDWNRCENIGETLYQELSQALDVAESIHFGDDWLWPWNL